MHGLELIGLGAALALVATAILRRLRRGVAAVGPAIRRRLAEQTIALDDFEPKEAQKEVIRAAVADFDRQRTPLTQKPNGDYDYDGPRAPAGRLFGIVHRGEIAMFFQWQRLRDEDANPVRAALQAFWRGCPGAVDEDGWPVKPEKVFEINPGLYQPPAKQPPIRLHADPDRMHPALRREILLAEAEE